MKVVVMFWDGQRHEESFGSSVAARRWVRGLNLKRVRSVRFCGGGGRVGIINYRSVYGV